MARGFIAQSGAYVTLADSPPPIVKAADETVTSSTTLQDDDHLVRAIGANETWVYEWLLVVTSGSNTPDIKLTVTVPAGATGLLSAAGLDPGATGTVAGIRWIAQTTFGTSIGNFGVLSGGPTFVVVRATVINAGTAGTVALQWAQNTSDASGVVVKAGSTLTARRAA